MSLSTRSARGAARVHSYIRRSRWNSSSEIAAKATVTGSGSTVLSAWAIGSAGPALLA